MTGKQTFSSTHIVDLTQDYSNIVQTEKNEDKDMTPAKHVKQEIEQNVGTKKEIFNEKRNDTKIPFDETTQRASNALMKGDVEFVKKDFSQLADLLNVRTSEKQTFNLELFKSNKEGNGNKTTKTSKVSDEEVIEIEREVVNSSKFNNMFDSIKLDDNQEDDLLTLMDMASKKEN